jgi:hypothetical protein
MWKRVMKGKGFRSEGLVVGLEARGEVQVAEAVRTCLRASGRDWTVVYESGMEPRYWMYERKLWQFLRWLLLCALNESEKKHVNQPSLSTSAGLGRKKGAYMLWLRVRVLRNGVERRVLVPGEGGGGEDTPDGK